ncbi:hypothetical protein G7Y89_g1269 [Cudoniella acicularis]|uniref:DhaK domain-containing protein n=1 Tax=Cudoniella acicularis TaxID=354080 RepID=A0A8H4RXM6_9HELO|nr:hypothetical protein G7Y89_g1269 [Cudoniella acicularis]
MPIHPHTPTLTGIKIAEGRVPDHHFIQDYTKLVEDSLFSASLTNPSLSVDLKNRVVYLAAEHPSQVSIVSGSGSGHDPAFAGFVGKGILAAAVVGKILSTPQPEQIKVALLNVDSQKGILVIIMNNEGDVFKFKSVIFETKAKGLNIELVIVGDDVSGGRIRARKHGRSGHVGTVLVLKIAGALAAAAAPLEEVTRVAKLASSHLLTVGCALSHVRAPNHPLMDPLNDEHLATEHIGTVAGLGEHTTPGSHKIEVDLQAIVQRLLRELLDWSDEDRSFSEDPSAGDQVLLVNNLGGLSGLELGAITLEIAKQLAKTYNLRPVRIYSGTFMTSLNELGFSITLLKVHDPGLKDGVTLLDLLDAPTEAVGWGPSIGSRTWEEYVVVSKDYKALPLAGANLVVVEVVENKEIGASYSYDAASKMMVSYNTPAIARKARSTIVLICQISQYLVANPDTSLVIPRRPVLPIAILYSFRYPAKRSDGFLKTWRLQFPVRDARSQVWSSRRNFPPLLGRWQPQAIFEPVSLHIFKKFSVSLTGTPIPVVQSHLNSPGGRSGSQFG